VLFSQDKCYDYGITGDSFETSVPWDKCSLMRRNVLAAVKDEYKKLGIEKCTISSRLSQTYDAGACVYFYLAYTFDSRVDPVEIYTKIEDRGRKEIIAAGILVNCVSRQSAILLFTTGGSISHHHGVGKNHSKWYKHSVSNVGLGLFKAVKAELDPKNIFATGNFLTPEDEENVVVPSPKL
jgi:alkyldihydroxyacetonephosphate synthase